MKTFLFWCGRDDLSTDMRQSFELDRLKSRFLSFYHLNSLSQDAHWNTAPARMRPDFNFHSVNKDHRQIGFQLGSFLIHRDAHDSDNTPSLYECID